MKTYSIFYYLLFFSLIIASSAWAIKPRPPLQLSLHQADVLEEVSRVTLIATANLDISRVELWVELSSGLSLMKGEEKWEGPLKKGETHQRELMIQNPGHVPREVTGKAIIHLDEGGVFIQKVMITLNGETQSFPLERSPFPPGFQPDAVEPFKSLLFCFSLLFLFAFFKGEQC